MKEWVGLIFIGVLYILVLYIREYIFLLYAEYFQELLYVAKLNKRTQYVVGQET